MMCLALHICLLMVKEAYIPDQGWGKGSVCTGEKSGIGYVNKGWKVEKETVWDEMQYRHLKHMAESSLKVC